MELPAQRWMEAIAVRRSIRSFSSRPVGQTCLQELTDWAAKLHDRYQEARAVILPEAPEGIFRGVLGSYGAVQGAPACAVFIADTTKPHHQEVLGYLGEGIILEATALGLGTCWVGGFFRSAVAREAAQIRNSDRILAVTPLGYPADTRWDEKLMKRLARSSRRKNLADICMPAPENWPEWALAGLEAARLAPSAVNRQPWWFTWEHNEVGVRVSPGPEVGSVSRRLDCGIAMLHFLVGAAQAGRFGQWEWQEAPAVGVFRPE